MTRTLPLEGLRVVEFSHMVMGPSAGLILGDLGADVIKVEPLGMGDNTRRLPGAGAGFFATFNRNKRSLALDLKKPKALALVKKLIARSDVVTENFRPGALDALGLGYEELAADHPRLIYCSLKGFLSGPYEDRAALDEVVQMMGGLAYMTGPPGRPLRAGASLNDMMGGMFAVIGILAAVQERLRTGRGQYVKSSLYENTAWLMSPHMAQFALTGQAPQPMPNRISAWAVYDVFETKDDLPIFIGVVSDTQWRAFAEEFARPDLLADPSLLTNPMRVAARDRIIPDLRDFFRRFTRSELEKKCARARLSYAPVKRPDELVDDPHLNAPGGMVHITRPDGHPMPVPALPLEMGGNRFGLRRDVPAVGADSAAIARELGIGDDAIKALAAEGVLGVEPRPRAETDVLPTAPTRNTSDPTRA